jgi:hypothetical protein
MKERQVTSDKRREKQDQASYSLLVTCYSSLPSDHGQQAILGGTDKPVNSGLVREWTKLLGAYSQSPLRRGRFDVNRLRPGGVQESQ